MTLIQESHVLNHRQNSAETGFNSSLVGGGKLMCCIHHRHSRNGLVSELSAVVVNLLVRFFETQQTSYMITMKLQRLLKLLPACLVKDSISTSASRLLREL